MLRKLSRLKKNAKPGDLGVAVSLLAAVGVAGCSAGAFGDDDSTTDGGYYGESAGDGDANDGDNGGDGDYTVDAGDVSFGGAGSIPDLPPLPEEVEDDASYKAPVATGRYLWSANPESGRVALIDVVDLTTQVLPAGLYPTFLTSVGSPDVPAALVLNVGSSDATRFRVTESEVLRDTVELHVGGNRWATSDSGDWAVAWSRPERGVVLDPTEGLQEITVVRLADEGMTPTRITVGYRPSHVQISADDERLIVVSEEGITLIDLTSDPEPYDWIDLGFAAENRDVSVNEAGTYALVRRSEDSVVEVVDLIEPEKSFELNFSAAVTDLDLADNGRAVAVIRTMSEVSTFTLEDVIADPTAIDTVNIPGEVFGSAVMTEDGKTAILYTNALLNEKVNIVDLRSANFLATRSLNTQAPVYSVAATPDGKHAVVLAAKDDLVLGDQGTQAEAFSVVALRDERFPRVVGTGAPVLNVALGNSFGLVTASSINSGVHETYLVEMPGLSVSKERLSTVPLAAGILEDLNLAYVAQSHPEGRVTFFDFEADQARTLTGFELSAEVVDE
jgi:hypothetical protein